MTAWLEQAYALADDIREPGFGAATVTATAWNARVHPEATYGLVGAATALIGNDALTALAAPHLPPCPDDKTLMSQAEELEGDVAEFLALCRRMIRDCQADLDAAWSRAAGAAQGIATAEAAQANATTSGQAAAAEGALAAAQAAQAQAIADALQCEAALEILADAEARLEHALRCLQRVPGDFAEHYEVPRACIRLTGLLPRDGDFLTPAAA